MQAYPTQARKISDGSSPIVWHLERGALVAHVSLLTQSDWKEGKAEESITHRWP